MPDVKYGKFQFKEQIEFFRRKLNLATQAWTDILHAQHDHAFVVAGANRDDLVADFRAAIDKAISQGTTLAEFRKDFDAIVEKYGWQYNGGRNWRSRVIYETNLRTSYAAGRWAQLQATKKARPYWEYWHSDAVVHPRPQHLAWDRMVLMADDPWWDQHYPPNGWGCQCTVHSLDDYDLAKLGKSGPDPTPAVEMREVTIGANGPSPRVVSVPDGVDPGFGYAPGKDAFDQLVQRALDKTTQLPAEQAAASADAAMALDSVEQSMIAGYEAWLEAVQNASLAGGANFYVGALSPELVATLYANNVEPATAAIAVRAAQIERASAAVAADLPQAVRNPAAVLLDTATNSLIYVTAGESAAQLRAYTVALPDAGAAENVNLLSAAELVDAAELARRVKSGDLVLLQGELP